MHDYQPFGTIEGMEFCAARVRRIGYKGLTYFQVKGPQGWINCGDPHHGETSSKGARQAIAHYGRIALRAMVTA